MAYREMRDWPGAEDTQCWDDTVPGVCSTQCKLYLVYALLGELCTRCMLYLVYAVLSVCFTLCLLLIIAWRDRER
jgi:hypothetical protein